MRRILKYARWAAIGIAAGGLAVVGNIPAGAASSNGSYSQPGWWDKYAEVVSGEVESAPPGIAGKSPTFGGNVDVSNEPGTQSETSIAINPNNPSQIVAGSNEIDRLPMRAYRSSDGGASWAGVDLPLPPPKSANGSVFGADPGVAWDLRGNVFYAYVVVFTGAGYPNGATINGTQIGVARSSDGGKTWSATYFGYQTGSSKFNDKPMITVDTGATSPYRNTVYVAWDHLGGNSTNAIVVARSTDGGKTFGAEVTASTLSNGNNLVIGADPFTGPDGKVYVAWHDIFVNRLMASASSNGGQSFGPAVTIAPTISAFDVGIPAMALRRALVYPACGADGSAGANRNTLYCSWMDSTAKNGTDVFVSRSKNGGSSWSAPARVSDDPSGVLTDQFNQWLAVDPMDGSVYLSWNDTRNDPTRASTDVYYTRSTDGLTFGQNVKVTTEPTNETCCGAEGEQYGDYEGIAAYGGIVHPVWTDRRTTIASLNEEVFTASIKPR